MHFWRRLQTLPGFKEFICKVRLRFVHLSGVKVMTRGDKLFKDARSSLQRVLAGPENNCPSNFRSLGCSIALQLHGHMCKHVSGTCHSVPPPIPRNGVVAVCSGFCPRCPCRLVDILRVDYQVNHYLLHGKHTHMSEKSKRTKVWVQS